MTPLTRKTPLRAKPRNITGTQSEAVLRGLQTAKKAKTHKKCPGCKQIVPLTRFGNLVKHTNEEGKTCSGKRKRKVPIAKVRKNQQALCDSMWRTIVKALAKGRCELCGEPGVDCHHLVSRRSRFLRHCVPNGMFLCKGCHMEFHNRDSQRAWHWMMVNRPDDYEFILRHKATIFKGDLDETEQRLRGLLDTVENES